MKRSVAILAVLAAFSLAATAWAGGSMCSGKSEGASKVAAGNHCTPGAGASAKEQCAIGSNAAVYSFAVPTAECDACIKSIQRAAMAQKGVRCAHVSLDNHMAYVAGDKKLDQRKIAKAIAAAGFKCSFKSEGAQARADMMKAMAIGDDVKACPAGKHKESKDRDKV